MNDYLAMKLAIINGEVSILEDNLQHLQERKDLHQKLIQIACKFEMIMTELGISTKDLD